MSADYPINIPSTLLRSFKKEVYARNFIGGEIRFGLLESYRLIEDPRKDETEGQASFFWNKKAPQLRLDNKTLEIVGREESDQNIHYSGSSINPYFVLCTSHPDVRRDVLRKFGEFTVLISDPIELLERIKIVWQKHPWALAGSVFIAPVSYNKEETLEANEYFIPPPGYSYSQKPRIYEEEREFRYVLECTFDAKRALGTDLTLRLPDCSDICSLT